MGASKSIFASEERGELVSGQKRTPSDVLGEKRRRPQSVCFLRIISSIFHIDV